MTVPLREARTNGILQRLSGFFVFLRTRGVKAGVGTELDLGRSLEVLGVTDRAKFRDACRAAVPKSPEELAILEDAFDAYWSGSGRVDSRSPPVHGGIPLRSPPARGTSRETAPRTHAVPLDRIRAVTVGVYSPDALPAGHPLHVLDPRNLAALRSGARRFRREAATLPGRRLVSSRHGRIDVRATTRKSVRTGGEWLELRRRQRKRLRAELVILWDVSGSMREHDSALFALVYVLQRVCRRTRVFAFSTEVDEITDRLGGTPYRRAVEIVSSSLGPVGGGTRIGGCLAEFRRRHGGIIHPWTTVLILSDGWDLGETDLLGRELQWLHRRAHWVVWVNPYAADPRFLPETGGMRRAMPHIDALRSPQAFTSSGALGPRRRTPA